jgi:ribonuclease D
LPDKLKLEGDLAIDTEAMGLNPHRDRLCLVQLSVGDGHAHLVQFSADDFNAPNLVKLLSNPDTAKIFHFARFDLAMIEQYLGVRLKGVFCTKLAAKLCRTFTERNGYKDLCRDLIGAEISKQQQTSDWGAAELSEDQLTYAASDVLHLHALRDKLTGLLQREERLSLARECFDFLPARATLDLAGWPEIDVFAHRTS